MNPKQKALLIAEMLDELIPNPDIPLDHTNSFQLLCSVLLSAQTTDKKVNEVTPFLFERAPDPFLMSKVPIDELHLIIKEIGLSQAKAKYLHQMANQLVDRHNGLVPQTFEELEALSGVGHKTASVVMAQAFGFHAFPVDTHIHRLMHRWGLSNGKNVQQTEKDAKELFPREDWNKIHLQIIYYGRLYSPARGWKQEKDPIWLRLQELNG